MAINNVTVNVHVGGETAISHSLITKREYGDPFAILTVGNAKLLVERDGAERLAAELADAAAELDALSEVAA